MLQKSPVLTPSLENLSYILRHREWWPEGFQWDYRYTDCCAIGLSKELWGIDPTGLHHGLRDSDLTWEASPSYIRIFASRSGKIAWWRQFPWNYYRQMSSITPDQIADQIDQYLASCHG
jgi:hypothetical protein